MDRFRCVDWNDDRWIWINLTIEFRSEFTDARDTFPGSPIQLVGDRWPTVLQVEELHGGVVRNGRKLVLQSPELVMLLAGHVHPHVLRHVVQRAFFTFESSVCVLLNLAVLR